MPRRVSLPAADELFRTTGGPAVQPSVPQGPQAPEDPARQPSGRPDEEPAESDGEASETDTGREESRTSPLPAQGPRGGSRGSAAPTGGQPPAAPQSAAPAAGSAPARGGKSTAPRRGRVARRPSGRERHDEKITVYVSAEELMDLEHARLVLRGEHGLAVDRGRIVREAVAVVLADLESRGDASILVRRLRGR
ncbi:hypothetical protein HCN52_19955 [Streptomyces bohaiensis]|uniref:Cobyrinic acid a,c-diamide synthase n=1 Tax=Streptomyces bohaiensis TaxID=1431344 RepID=A0ABX1CKM4_9ACTN|nr:hypothetical protein [Streptomyces bohaiensis]